VPGRFGWTGVRQEGALVRSRHHIDGGDHLGKGARLEIGATEGGPDASRDAEQWLTLRSRQRQHTIGIRRWSSGCCRWWRVMAVVVVMRVRLVCSGRRRRRLPMSGGMQRAAAHDLTHGHPHRADHDSKNDGEGPDQSHPDSIPTRPAAPPPSRRVTAPEKADPAAGAPNAPCRRR